MQQKPVKVGVIGCGSICQKTYMPNMINKFRIIDVVGCADLIDERATLVAETYGIRKMTNEEIYNDPEIEVVVNLTYPESHVEVSRDAMNHGKHVYCEKMMAGTFEEATELYELAKEKGVLFTTAPDTFLGAWVQSARWYIDHGMIGEPISIHAQHTCHYAPDSPLFDLTPDTFFFPLHKDGGLPFDWGGYYLHAMINLLGSVKRVAGFGGNFKPNQAYTNPRHPKYKENFFIDTPTSIFAALEFENGVHGTFHLTSDASRSENFMITGTEGTLILGNPNNFGATLTLVRNNIENPGFGGSLQTTLPKVGQFGENGPVGSMPLPLLHGYSDSSRGIGLADMCYAIRNGRRPRAHCDIGYHAIEIIHGIIESDKTDTFYHMTSHCDRPKPIRPNALVGTGMEAELDD